MYSDKKNVLQLAALLKEHEIRNVVLCPGSRNIPIVQTLARHPFFTCHAVTDERNAGFFAIGLALNSGKPAAICCSARRAGTTATLDQLAKYPEFFHMPLVNGSYWAMVHGSNPEQVLQDAEGCAVMQELGRNMAWLLHCIEAGRAAGFEHPQNPKRPMTNFIR